jgi:WD40 repeat protein
MTYPPLRGDSACQTPTMAPARSTGSRWPPRRFALPNKGPLDLLPDGARLVFSPDGQTLAVTSEREGRIFLLDAASGRERDRLDGPQNQFKALAFSPDGTILATGIDTGKRAERRELAIRLWDVAARKERGRVPAHRSSIRALAFSADGRWIVSASEDGTALVWDVARIVGRRTAAVEPGGSMVRKD